MDQGKLNSHYKRLAGSYNQAFTSSTDKDKKGYVFLGEEGARTLMELLKLRKQDKLVDLGAGTCVNALQLAQLAELEQSVLCVEPVQEMLDVALKQNPDNIETFCETAEVFTARNIRYDKIMIKGTVHHFPRENLEQIFSGIYRQLNNNGILLIEKVSGKANISSFFKRGHDLHHQTHQGLSERIMEILEGLGMRVEYKTVMADSSKTKAETIEYMRNRSVSSWEMLTDEEIEEGVRSIQESGEDIITSSIEKEIIVATKSD